MDSIGGYNYKSETNNIEENVLSMAFDTDDISNIAEIDNINMEATKESKNNIDYSNIENLKNNNDLLNVIIMNINGESCPYNGKYIIYGKISDASNIEEKYSDIKILVSSTESIGIYEVEIRNNDKSIAMICQNSDKLYISKKIEKSMIKDPEGNRIFKINIYKYAGQFSYDISIKLYWTNTHYPTNKYTNKQLY